MKKSIVFTMALTAFVLNSIAFANDTTNPDTNVTANDAVISETAQETAKEVSEVAEVPTIEVKKEIINEDNLTVDTIKDYVEPQDMIPIDEENTEFIYKLNNKVGYIDQKTNFGFITDYESMTSFDNFLKVKNDNKYGVITKQGKIVLQPLYQKINIFYSDGNEYLETKEDGKYKLYDETGELVPFDKMFAMTQNKSIMLIRDLKPELQEYAIDAATLAAIYNKKVEKPFASTTQTVDSNDIEISDIPVSNRIKNAITESKEAIVDTQEQVEAVETQVATESATETVAETVEKVETAQAMEDAFVIGKNKYYIITENNKIGIVDSDNKVIIPTKYDFYKVVYPSKNAKSPVIVVSRNRSYSIFNKEGELLAEQVYDKINIYGNTIYTFAIKNGKGVLSSGGKDLGIISKVDNKYKYVDNRKFALFKPTYAADLVITMINVANL